MRKYIVYDDNGIILRWGVCSTKNLFAQAQSGEHVMETNELKREFDLNNKVANPTGLSPTIVKK